MTTYYVEIQAGNREGTSWQTVAPADPVTDWDGSAQELADWVASNQNVANGDRWRVLIWDSEDTHGEPVAEHEQASPPPVQHHELIAWLGPAADELSAEQVDRLRAEADRITERYPDPDDQDRRDAALSAAVQYLLGETTPEDAARRHLAAQREAALASAAAAQIGTMLVADNGGKGKSEAARRVGIDRMGLLKALGER